MRRRCHLPCRPLEYLRDLLYEYFGCQRDQISALCLYMFYPAHSFGRTDLFSKQQAEKGLEDTAFQPATSPETEKIKMRESPYALCLSRDPGADFLSGKRLCPDLTERLPLKSHPSKAGTVWKGGSRKRVDDVFFHSQDHPYNEVVK